MLSVAALTYRYPRGTSDALDGIDFEVGRGEIFGFLGPNGAGKTTTQRILTGLLRGYRGRVRVLGRALGEHGPDYYNHIGVHFEHPNLYERLTAEENLEFYRRFFGVATESPRELLRMMDLPEGDRRKVGQYSQGMKVRVMLARSLLNRPKLWFLDEPTAAQDPQHQVSVRDLIRERRGAGTTVFLTTHNMTVAEELCDRVALIVNGRIAAVDSPRNLRLGHGRKVARLEYRTAEGLRRGDFELDVPASKEAFVAAVRAHDVETIHTLEPSLEDVFIKITGRRLGSG
ncbi:MAG: ABC transporter ATP-binding protein [Bacillota bacterium]|nr:ABC transporter ATP-binding protein [Bacillota bacterium]